ncbi:unnamed protein product [Closterium sp. NIES-54]
MDDVKLRGEFRAAHLLTFMFISRCCSPVVQLALKSCRERQDAGHHAWHFILSTYQVRDDLYIEQLEEKMTHIRMGEESVSDYCNRARRRMRMAGAEYSTASYISQIVKGLPHGYNLMKRENYAAPMKLNHQQGQRTKPGGGGSGGGRSTNDVDKKRSTRDKGRGGGDRRQDCWICGDPDHLSYECLDRDDNDEDDSKGGRGRSTSRRPRRDAKPRKEKHTSKKTSSTKDVDNSSGKGRGDGEASCSMVGVVEPTVSLALEAGEDFQAMAAAVQASPMAVLLESGCSYHLMGKKVVFVDMVPSDGVKHVRGFNGALQPVKGRGTIALQGKAGKRVLIPDVRYQNGMAEREMRTAVESVRTMLLHMGVQHHWWHLALRQAVWFMVLEQQRGGKLAPKARWGLHLGVSPESKGWEVFDLTNNKVVMSVKVIFYETLLLENRWVLTTKYRIDDTVEREKARLVVQGFTQVCGADYDETYSPSPLLWYRALDSVLLGAGWKKSQVYEALYFKASDVDLLGAGLRRRPAPRQQQPRNAEEAKGAAGGCLRAARGFAGRQGGRVLKTPVSVNAYAELTFDDEEAQERKEEEYWQKVGSLQFAATTSRPDIMFACSKLGSGLTFDGGPESLKLIGYVDANDAGDKQNQTSTDGYVFHMVRRGNFVLKYIPTIEQPVDFLTKALHFPAFNRCSVAIGQVRLADVGDGDDDVQQ